MKFLVSRNWYLRPGLTSRYEPLLWAFILFLLLFPIASFSQETPPQINYSSAIYQAHNQNWAIDQSVDHLIYAANSDGLLEYDGSNWKLYQLPDQQIVRSLLCDNITIKNPKTNENFITDRRIYVGGFSEFGYWQNSADGQLTYYSLSKNANFKSLKTEEIWHIVKTPKFIYFQSFSSIYRYDGKNLTEITGTGNFMFLRYVNHRLLIQLIGKGLYELKNEKFVPLAGTETLSQTIVSSILPFPGNRILITTSKHGLFIFDDGELIPWNITISEELKRNILNQAIVLSQDSSFVFGTIQKGIYIVSSDGTLKYKFNKDNGLQNNTILSLSEDRLHNLWTGLDQGIGLIKMSSPIISYQTTDNPLGSTYAAALWRGNLYVGSNNGVFVKKWNSSEDFRPIPGLGGQTWNLKVIDDQLLCGHNDATFRIEENGISKISNVTGGWVFLPVKTNKDTLLLQGSYTGLHVYRKNRSGMWYYAHTVKGILPFPIKQIVRDRDGSFWLGHAYKGLYHTKLSPELDSAISWKEYKSPKDIPSEFSVDITDWKNKIHIRSGNKFFEADAKGVLLADMDLVTPDQEPFKIRAGKWGDWFDIYMSRVVYHTAALNSQILDLKLIRNNETIIPLSDQNYFFCLDNGYALYNRLQGNRSVSGITKPLIRKVANIRNLAETFPLSGNPSLPSDVRSIRIMYSLPLYGQNVQYKYRLSGLSEQWTEWTDQNFVEYTNLASASYTFEVKSTANNQITSYRFTIEPYWYETFWARLAGIIVIIMLVTLLIFYQEKRIVMHRNKLMLEQEEKLRQERLSNERKIMEIQNEKLQSEIKSKSQQISNVAINVVRKNEILEEIRDELKQVKEEMGLQLPNIHYQKLLNSIERNVAGKEDWILFEENFNEIHEEFFKRLRTICPSVSPSELRLAACLRMNLSTKEMAPALGISIRGVEIKRYRLRKKLGLDNEANLVDYMMGV